MLENSSETYFINRELDVARVSLEAAKFSQKIGFSSSAQNNIATVASELGRNIIRYAKEGKLTLTLIQEPGIQGIEIIAEDKGPGIENIEQAMTDHFTTTPNSLGLGLKAVKRLMDEFSIESSKNCGTRIIARRWLKYGKN